jgi:hypothetical protein
LPTVPLQNSLRSEGNVNAETFIFINRGFDNFSFDQETEISDIHWQGSYFTSTPLAAPVPNAQQFLIAIFSDNNGRPDVETGSLREIVTPISNVNETFVRTELLGLNLFLVYDYSFDLPSDPFVAEADTTYWLAVQVRSSFTAVFSTTSWGWNNGTGGDNSSISAIFLSPLTFFVNFPGDRAFALTGPTSPVPVPAPSTLLIMADALGMLGFAAWKRRKSA